MEEDINLEFVTTQTHQHHHPHNHANINANKTELDFEESNLYETTASISKTDQKQEKFALIKEITTEVFSNSTMHGLSRIIKAKSWIIKIIWITFLLTSIGSFVNYSIESLYDFLDYKVTTEIRTIYETPTIFPTVTICNKNMFTTDFGIKTIKMTIKNLNIPNVFNYYVFANLSVEDRYRASDNATFGAANKVFKYSDRDKRKLGHSIEDFLIECKFDDVFCNTTDDFIWYFDSIYGNCYKYNTGRNSRGKKIDLKKSIHPGKFYNGLKLTLFESMPKNLKRISYSGNGFVIKLENNSYTVGGNSEIDLLSGFETNLAIDRIYSTQLPSPYSDCIIDNKSPKRIESDLYDMFLKANTRYTQKDCLDLCKQKFYILYCNCSLFQIFSLYNETYCNTFEQLNCLNSIYFEKILSTDFMKENCFPLCPLECYTNQYKTSQSNSQFSPETYMDLIRKRKNYLSKYDNETLSDESIKRGIVKLNIYYDSLSYTQITESAKMNKVSLLASIGGFMGMFLGMSLMTFVEILDILVRLILHKMTNGLNFVLGIILNIARSVLKNNLF